ncbi:MAG TPA: MoaD/ThiS family protein [Frankiaceae bacterium]|jgi:molybdopterin converting factor small subunit|nr:MoaD/ThiS family protein [Frankiaceae bacterium]
MTSVTVHYWAAAREAAGCASEVLAGDTLADVIEQSGAKHGPEMARLLGICSYIVGDRPVKREAAATLALQEGQRVEVLPPFAGGSAVIPAPA